MEGKVCECGKPYDVVNYKIYGIKFQSTPYIFVCHKCKKVLISEKYENAWPKFVKTTRIGLWRYKLETY